MKSIKKIAAAMAILAATGTASAGVDPAGAASAATFATPYSFSHSIVDQGFVAGSTLSSAVLTILLTDPLRGSEMFQLTIGSQVFTPSTVNNPNHANNGGNTTITIPLEASSLLDLKDGSIDLVAATNNGGNYTFMSSSLAFEVAVQQAETEVRSRSRWA